MNCHFRIRAWNIASNRCQTHEQWLAWANNALDPLTLPEHKPDVSFLPAMQRRRLSLSARLLFQAAHPLLTTHQSLPLVLASHDGEVNRSFELWQTLLTEHSVSPTSFGLSVHNALAGQWSMLCQDMSENTAIAAKEDLLESAILEAAGILADGNERVLVVIADEPLNAQFNVQPLNRAPFAYALALLLEAGEEWHIQQHRLPTPSNALAPYWQALNLAKNLYLNHYTFCNTYSHHAWQWHKQGTS